MGGFDHHASVIFVLSIGAIVGASRLLGELARRVGQPTLVGELLAGIALGPTLLGRLWPNAYAELFPSDGPILIAQKAIASLGVVFFLLVAGMEVNLEIVKKQSRTAFIVGSFGLAVPFVTGYFSTSIPILASNLNPGVDTLVSRLFLATAFSISALPVIARILIDIGRYRTDFGMTVISAAMLNDLVGWLVFGVIIGMLPGATTTGFGVGTKIGLTLLFFGLMLTVGTKLLHKALRWIRLNSTGTDPILGFVLACALFSAAFTDRLGIHAVFGAFVFGVALGETGRVPNRIKISLGHFVSFFFAPVFFGSIGLHLDLIRDFNLGLVLAIVLLATICKFAACAVGARAAGEPVAESLAIGAALNARGAMEIILGLAAFQAGIITAGMLVALIAMALVTSMTSGSIINRLLGQPT